MTEQRKAIAYTRISASEQAISELSLEAQHREVIAEAERSGGGKGVDLISSAESLDTGSDTGQIVIKIMDSVSQWDREVIGERTSAILQDLKAQGKSTGNPNYGFEAGEDGKLIENELEQAVLQRVAELRAQLLPWARVAGALTDAGVRTRRGTVFSRAGILMTEQGLPLVIISADAATTSSHGPLGELIGVDLADALLSLHATMDQCEHEPELMSDYLTNKETVNHLVSGLEAVYALWNACDPARREDLKDPLAALIESWLSDQPVPADTRKTGIMPRAIIRDTDLEGTLFDLTEDIRPETDGQARLPGFALYDDSAIALPLQLRDFTGIPRSRGRGAALADRIWVEAVMWKPVEYRFLSRPVSVYWGDFINALMPNGRYCQRDAVRIVEALHIVHNLRLPWQIGKTGGERAVVIVLDIPRHWNAYEDVVTFEINLPPGVRDRGPLVYKPTLRVLGQKSALQWRGYLNLCYQFDRYGARNGRYIQPTRPRLLRDVQDRLLRIDGTLLLDKDGKPVRTWTIKRKRNSEMIWEPRPGLVPLNDRGEPVPTLKDAAQERNPAADRYPVLSPEQQVALVYPPAPNTLRKSARSMRRSRAEDALSNMAGKGYIITEHLDGGVRILPPLGWGAGYGG